MSNITLSFRRMGADVQMVKSTGWRAAPFVIDVKNTPEGEKFEISGTDLAREDIKILDIDKEEKHLLMMWREKGTGTKHRFLCGHDERHWFVAAIPGEGVKDIHGAMEALKPEAVKDRERKAGLKGAIRRQRHNPARKRQGEWFFIPCLSPMPKDAVILKNEPINRGGGKPHKCEFLTRTGGVRVWVCANYPNGVPEKQYRKIMKNDKDAKKWNWQLRVADAKVFVRGKVSHADHATLDLGTEWHEVLMNRESDAPSMRHVRFID